MTENEKESTDTEYLRFSAYSLKQLITRKLAADTKFTDQIYDGSNLAILIDIVCYMYQCLLYNLNNAASEAMWTDSQVYANINRLAKLIGYCPAGATAANCEFVTSDIFPSTVIPRYACITTDKTDSTGKTVFYSTVVDQTTQDGAAAKTILMYNGRWRMHETIFQSNGNPWLTLKLGGVTSDSSQQTYVSDKFIDVYVQDRNTGKLVKWQKKEGLFSSTSFVDPNQIYSSQDKIYSVRLDENKQYQVFFGDGKHGAIPERDASIYVFYLESNGPEGMLQSGDVVDAKLKHSASSLGIDDELYQKMFSLMEGDEETTRLDYVLANVEWNNPGNSSSSSVEESVEEIRRSAPESRKIGGRLVTADDWRYFTLNRFRDSIADCVCQNNWGYVSTFYRWLYNLGEQNHSDGKYYLRRNKMAKYDYRWADAADVNNVYLWLKTRNKSELYLKEMEKQFQEVKTIVQEPVFLEALDVYFMPCAQDASEVKKLIADGDYSFSGNYLEIAVSDNYNVSAADVSSRVAKAIAEFFAENRVSLGCAIDTSRLRDAILELDDVSRIRTVYIDPDTKKEQIVSGVSLAAWTASYIDHGDDLTVQASPKQLEVFQFPVLYTKNLQSYIRVIGKSASTSFVSSSNPNKY